MISFKKNYSSASQKPFQFTDNANFRQRIIWFSTKIQNEINLHGMVIKKGRINLESGMSCYLIARWVNSSFEAFARSVLVHLALLLSLGALKVRFFSTHSKMKKMLTEKWIEMLSFFCVCDCSTVQCSLRAERQVDMRARLDRCKFFVEPVL